METIDLTKVEVISKLSEFEGRVYNMLYDANKIMMPNWVRGIVAYSDKWVIAHDCVCDALFYYRKDAKEELECVKCMSAWKIVCSPNKKYVVVEQSDMFTLYDDKLRLIESGKVRDGLTDKYYMDNSDENHVIISKDKCENLSNEDCEALDSALSAVSDEEYRDNISEFLTKVGKNYLQGYAVDIHDNENITLDSNLLDIRDCVIDALHTAICHDPENFKLNAEDLINNYTYTYTEDEFYYIDLLSHYLRTIWEGYLYPLFVGHIDELKSKSW